MTPEKICPDGLSIRAMQIDDLPAVNAVITDAVGTWGLPAAVLARTLPMFGLRADELGELNGLVARIGGQIVAVATWTAPGPGDTPAGKQDAVLLHGLYVRADHHRRGIGRRLLAEAASIVVASGHDALATRAQRAAEGFFLAQGFAPFPDEGEAVLYPRRLWRDPGPLATDP
ncbi:MAG: GNAT family N-acetyltransferase [Burkholderiaceae bacterium]